MSDAVLGVAISSCLGLGAAVGLGAGGPTGGVKTVECRRFRIGRDGYESPVDDEGEEGGAGDEAGVKETFDVFFSVGFGGLSGEWAVKGLDVGAGAGASAGTGAVGGDGSADEDGNGSGDQGREEGEEGALLWKGRFLHTQRQLWEAQEEVQRLKDRVLDAVW